MPVNLLAGRKLPDSINFATAPAVRATMDLTRTTTENQRHWRETDNRSGRTAYTLAQRKVARERSRLEAINNAWYAGMLRTAANHIVGTGPRLQVLTDDPDVNLRIEKAWKKWAAATRFAEKLRIAVESYWRDGEVFGMRARSVRTSIGLDTRLYETDQVSQPYRFMRDPSVEDGKRIDNLGEAVEYWIYDQHPGNTGIGYINLLAGEWYPACDVWHLYRADRPGQIRGIPRCTPGLEDLAHGRRFSKATLGAAEAAALWAVFMKTTGAGVTPKPPEEEMMALDFIRDAMNFLPEGWEPIMVDPKHPATTEEMYQRIRLMYFCRCANMPYSLASGTSKDSNFASAKMDIKNLWEPEVKCEQDAITNIVLNSTFRWFLEDAVMEPGVLDGAPSIDEIEFRFEWPPLPQADEIDVANAATIRITSGQSTLREEYAKCGKDFDGSMVIAARDYGVSVEQYKQALFAKHFGVSGAVGGTAPIDPAGDTDADTGNDMSAGAFTGTNRRDHTNNEKSTDDVLQSYAAGASEFRTKASLMRLGWGEVQAISMMDEVRAQAEEGATA